VKNAKNGVVTGVTDFVEGIPQELRTTPPQGGSGAPRLGSLAPLKGKEEEVDLRARAWGLVQRLEALDRAKAQEYRMRLNRAPGHEVPGLVRELKALLDRFPSGSDEAPRPNGVEGGLEGEDIPEEELPF
jgi:hypothetical protein